MSGTTHVFTAQAERLGRLDASTQRRRLVPANGADFSSNDYLGIGRSGLLADAARAAIDRGVPLGSGGSRLLRGNHPEHEALEADAAQFFGCQSALFFASGFAANSALLSTLPQRHDLIVHDALIHASAHEGMRLGWAQAVSARHNDVGDFEAAIRRYRDGGGNGRVWIAVESLYSMDGDRAPLDALTALADRHDAVLVIDEAHATGVFGMGGRGLAEQIAGRENVIALRTLGKALGCEGALVCGSSVVTDFLVNRARGFIFSTAPSPLMAAVGRAALDIAERRQDLRDDLWSRVRLAESLLAPLGASVAGSQIIPVIVGENDRAMELAAMAQDAGYDVRGIRPPTVPRGTARLRVSITRNASPNDIRGLAEVMKAAAA